MSSEHKAVVLRWFEEWWNLRRGDVMEEVTTPDCLSTVEGLDGALDRDQADDIPQTYWKLFSW